MFLDLLKKIDEQLNITDSVLVVHCRQLPYQVGATAVGLFRAHNPGGWGVFPPWQLQ